MIAFWKRFWTTLISIAGVVGLYLAARAENFLWAFWLVVLAALTITTTTLFAPRSLDWIRRIRDYPRLLEAAARLQSDKDGLAQNVDRAVASAESNWDKGVAEGRAHVLGCLIAQSLDRMPELKGVETIEGQAVLLARWDLSDQILGARFHLEIEATGYIRGVLEVIDFDEDRHLLRLVCVSTETTSFWEHLADRAEVETAVPIGVALRAASFGEREPVAGVGPSVAVEETET